MSSSLIDSLRALVTGQPGAFNVVAETMYEALNRDDSKFLNDALTQVLLQEDQTLLDAFDGMLNMFCTEPLSQTYGNERQWRSYAVTAILRHPVGLVVTRLGDMSSLEALLAKELEIGVERIKCDPLVLPTWAVYNDGPVDAYQQCQASKIWVEGLLKADPRNLAVNFWQGSEKVQQVDEAVLMVNIYSNVDEGQGIFEKIQKAALDQHALLMLEAPVATGPAVPVKVLLVDAGSPWTQFNEALHTSDMYRVGGALNALMQKHSVLFSDLSLFAAYVEEDADDHHTLRISVLRKETGELLAGMLFTDLYEPEHFLLKTDELINMLNMGFVQRLEPTYYEAEIHQEGDIGPRFFVPGEGWKLPPELI